MSKNYLNPFMAGCWFPVPAAEAWNRCCSVWPSFFPQDAQSRMDQAVDRVEPVMSAFLTVTVGVALLSTMLPLIGILGSIG